MQYFLGCDGDYELLLEIDLNATTYTQSQKKDTLESFFWGRVLIDELCDVFHLAYVMMFFVTM